MNERVKAILLTAFKLSPEERQELARALVDTISADPSDAEQQLATDENLSGRADDGPPQLPTSDVLAKYLDV